MKVTYEGCAKLKNINFANCKIEILKSSGPSGIKKPLGRGFFEVQVGKRDSIPEHFLLQLSALLRLE